MNSHNRFRQYFLSKSHEGGGGEVGDSRDTKPLQLLGIEPPLLILSYLENKGRGG